MQHRQELPDGLKNAPSITVYKSRLVLKLGETEPILLFIWPVCNVAIFTYMLVVMLLCFLLFFLDLLMYSVVECLRSILQITSLLISLSAFHFFSSYHFVLLLYRFLLFSSPLWCFYCVVCTAAQNTVQNFVQQLLLLLLVILKHLLMLYSARP